MKRTKRLSLMKLRAWFMLVLIFALMAFAGQLEYQFQEGWGEKFEVASTITSQGDEEVCARLCCEGIRVFTSEEYLELTQTETPGNQMSMQF